MYWMYWHCKLLFYNNTFALLLINVQQHFLHTTFSKLYIHAVTSHWLHFCGTFSTLQPTTRSHKENSCSAVSENDNLCKVWAFLPYLLLPFWKGDKAKKLQHLPKTLEQAMMWSQLEMALSNAIFVFKLLSSMCLKRVWVPG